MSEVLRKGWLIAAIALLASVFAACSSGSATAPGGDGEHAAAVPATVDVTPSDLKITPVQIQCRPERL